MRSVMDKRNIYGMTPVALREYFRSRGENPAKADIVFDGIYRRAMPLNALALSERVTKMLAADFCEELPRVTERCESENAAKLLLDLGGEYVEAVLMRQRFGTFVCVSTQVGCSMGCAFCRSGMLKKQRSLTSAEMTGQVLALSREFGVKINGVSVMGIGEPFDNFDAVREFCEIITAGKGLGLGERHITVSTCGIVPKIYEYADLAHPCNLAISLHAPTDELRSSLMPINRAYPLSQLIPAAEYYTKKTNRRAALEYVMLNGVNDSVDDARRLAQLIGARRFYVNIIPYNATDSGFSPSPRERIMAFYDVLKKHGISVTMRREFGSGLNAACGQLSAEHSDGGALF